MKPYNIKFIRWLSGIILVIIFAQLTAFAQTTQQEKVVNSPGSVLHERIKKVADSILAALGVDIRFIVSHTTKSPILLNSAASLFWTYLTKDSPTCKRCVFPPTS